MKQHYKHMFDQVLAQTYTPSDQVEQQRLAPASRCAPPKSEVSSMKRSKKSIRILLTAAAVAVILTIGALAASDILSCTTYLTGGQATVRDGNDGYLYFEITGPSDPDFSPVEVRDGKVWLTTETGQALDITGQFSETEAYVYTYTDENNLIHDVLVGGTPDNYSCFEFLYHQDGSMDSVLGTYPDGYDGFHEPAWLIAYRQEQGIPVVEAESEMVQPAEETS